MTPTWSKADTAELLRLRATNMTRDAIAAAMGRSRCAVDGKLYRLSLRPQPQEPYHRHWWEMEPDQRRIAVWNRAREAAAKTRRQNEMLSFPR